MYCGKCGTYNDDNAVKCSRCGNIPGRQDTQLPMQVVHYGENDVPSPPIPNYLVQSILVTLLCCVPLGVPAIVYSSMVNS